MVYLFLSVLALLVVGIAIAAIPFFRETEQKRREWEQKQKRDRELRELREAEAKKQEEEKRWDNSFEIQQLLKQARGTAKERTPEARENIVTLKLTGSFSSSRIKATEHKLLKEYTKFMTRPDIEKIKIHYPEIISWKKEPMILLELVRERQKKQKEKDEERQIKQQEEEERLKKEKEEAKKIKELKDLLLEASTTAWKRTPEMREKIVASEAKALLDNESNIILEYRRFMSRPDIKEIEESCQEVIEFKSEPLELLKLAWEKKEQAKTQMPLKKETPEEFVARTLKNRTRIAKEKRETIRAILREKLEEQRSRIQIYKEVEKIIREDKELSEPEQEELLNWFKENSQTILEAGDEAVELM